MKSQPVSRQREPVLDGKPMLIDALVGGAVASGLGFLVRLAQLQAVQEPQMGAGGMALFGVIGAVMWTGRGVEKREAERAAKRTESTKATRGFGIALLPAPSGNQTSLKVRCSSALDGVLRFNGFLTATMIFLGLWNEYLGLDPSAKLGLFILWLSIAILGNAILVLVMVNEHEWFLFDPQTESVFFYKDSLERNRTLLFQFDDLACVVVKLPHGDWKGHQVELQRVDGTVVPVTSCGMQSSAEIIGEEISSVTGRPVKID